MHRLCLLVSVYPFTEGLDSTAVKTEDDGSGPGAVSALQWWYCSGAPHYGPNNSIDGTTGGPIEQRKWIK